MPPRFNASQLRSAMNRANSQMRQAQSKLKRAAGELDRSLRRVSSDLRHLESQVRRLRSPASRRTMVTLEIEVRRMRLSGEPTLLVHQEEWEELRDQDRERLHAIARLEGMELEVVDDNDLEQLDDDGS